MDKKELLETLSKFVTTHKDLLIHFGVTFAATFLAIWVFSLTTNIKFEPRRPEFMPPPPPPPMQQPNFFQKLFQPNNRPKPMPEPPRPNNFINNNRQLPPPPVPPAGQSPQAPNIPQPPRP